MTKKTKKPDLTKITPDQAQEEFAKLMAQIIQLCSSDIQRHALQNFISSPLDREVVYQLALKIANTAHNNAVQEIDNWFLSQTQTPKI